MKNKLYFQFAASCMLLLFMVLTYLVKFYVKTLSIIDQPIANWLRQPLTPTKTAFFTWITKFSNAVVIILVGLVMLYLLWQRQHKIEMAWLSLNLALALLLQLLFKTLIQRPRPPVEHLVNASLSSFPSGHALSSVLCYGTCLLLIPLFVQSKRLQYLCQLTLLLLIGLIGLSRVYLGVHYFSDVLAGFSLGLACLLGGYPIYQQQRVIRVFQRKQK